MFLSTYSQKKKIIAIIVNYTLLPYSVNTLRYHCHKKPRDSLQSSLDWLLFATELEFLKILLPRLPQNSSNLNTECAGKSKQLYSLWSTDLS